MDWAPLPNKYLYVACGALLTRVRPNDSHATCSARMPGQLRRSFPRRIATAPQRILQNGRATAHFAFPRALRDAVRPSAGARRRYPYARTTDRASQDPVRHKYGDVLEPSRPATDRPSKKQNRRRHMTRTAPLVEGDAPRNPHSSVIHSCLTERAGVRRNPHLRQHNSMPTSHNPHLRLTFTDLDIITTPPSPSQRINGSRAPKKMSPFPIRIAIFRPAVLRNKSRRPS